MLNYSWNFLRNKNNFYFLKNILADWSMGSDLARLNRLNPDACSNISILCLPNIAISTIIIRVVAQSLKI